MKDAQMIKDEQAIKDEKVMQVEQVMHACAAWVLTGVRLCKT